MTCEGPRLCYIPGVRRWIATVCFSLLAALGCAHGPEGRLQYQTLQSQSEDRPMKYGVYLPPQWDGRTELPVVILLHGAGDDETSADRKIVLDALDEAIITGDLPPFILLAPNGDRGFWVNWQNGQHAYRDWVLEEALPDLRRRYPTIAGREALHILGVSMGGGGGLQMWLSNPEQFASASLLSAPILNEDETRRFLRRFMSKRAIQEVFGPEGDGDGVDPFLELRSADRLGGSRLLFGAATRDVRGVLRSNQAFHTHLREHEVPHQFLTFEGRHAWTSWADVFVHALCHQLQPTCPRPTPAGWAMQSYERHNAEFDPPARVAPAG
ncbi:MAG: hypothetical protein B7733_09860 [Myxococcales bacterium FL481]|nr:MAG: hypothetical protein B7733_09860 [Myxococcales bacterium FL481]